MQNYFMKLRKTALCGLLSAALLLTGCNNNYTSSEDSGAASNGEGSAESSEAPSNIVDNVDDMITSSKPPEKAGFEGNVSDIVPKNGDLIAEIEIQGFGVIKAVLFPNAAPIGVENFQKLAESGFYKGLKIHRVMKDFMFQGGSVNGDGTGGDALVGDGSFGVEVDQNARHFYGALCYANAQGSNSTQFYIVNEKAPQDLADFDIAGYKGVIEEGKEYLKEAINAGLTEYAEYYQFQTQYYQNTVDWVQNATDAIKTRYAEKGGTPFLDGNYTVFGQVYEGFDVVESISAVTVENDSRGELSKPVQDIIIKDVTVSAYNE